MSLLLDPTLTPASASPEGTEALRTLFLVRESLLLVEEESAGPVGDNAKLMGELEARLLGLGYLLNGAAYRALAALPAQELYQLSKQSLSCLSAHTGAHVPHLPLFRDFPHRVPGEPHAFFQQLVLNLLFQCAEQPCVLCGAESERVSPLSPCGHLVCSECFDGKSYSGCPLCGGRVDAEQPFLLEMPGAEPHIARRSLLSLPPAQKLRLITLSRQPDLEARRLMGELLGRTSALSPADLEALDSLLSHAGEQASEWLPGEIPARESMALVVARLMAREPEQGSPLLARYARSGTDLLRITNLLMGGDAGLLSLPPKGERSLPRRTRAALLDAMDALPVDGLIEDLLRRPELSKRLARTLHPFERHARRPRLALAFTLLRQGRVGSDSLSQSVLRGLEESETVQLEESGRLLHHSWARGVEEAFQERDLPSLLSLLGARPGLLLRRMDQLLRMEGVETQLPELLRVLEEVLPQASGRLLLGLEAHLAARGQPAARRVFLPKGESAHLWSTDETREPLPESLSRPVRELIQGELLRRASELEPLEEMLLDQRLARVPAPLSERAASRSLLTLPRGSVLPLAAGEGPLRLFVHWTDPAGLRVDLDLAVAFFNRAGELTSLCDYTKLSAKKGAALHSGDLTSAPAPLGATEYVDLDLPSLRRQGVRQVACMVFSFNQVPFQEMDDAFAGFMNAPLEQPTRDAYGCAIAGQFDPAAVLQRFELEGESQVSLSMVLDLDEMTTRWADLNLAGKLNFNSVWSHQARLNSLIADLPYLTDSKPTMLGLARLHAAARAQTVWIRQPDGSLTRLTREGRSPLQMLRALEEGEGERMEELNLQGESLAVCLDEQLELPNQSALCAMQRNGEHGGVRVTPGELCASLG